ncbi:hypothetical protein FRC15_005810, partial [Serendipita sp. 397]
MSVLTANANANAANASIHLQSCRCDWFISRHRLDRVHRSNTWPSRVPPCCCPTCCSSCSCCLRGTTGFVATSGLLRHRRRRCRIWICRSRTGHRFISLARHRRHFPIWNQEEHHF